LIANLRDYINSMIEILVVLKIVSFIRLLLRPSSYLLVVIFTWIFFEPVSIVLGFVIKWAFVFLKDHTVFLTKVYSLDQNENFILSRRDAVKLMMTGIKRVIHHFIFGDSSRILLIFNQFSHFLVERLRGVLADRVQIWPDHLVYFLGFR
jgi:hypothetical protein